jgi:hypothetical protein
MSVISKRKKFVGMFFVCFFLLLGHTKTVKTIWRLSSFTGKERPQVPFNALFQARVGTRVELPTFRKLAG